MISSLSSMGCHQAEADNFNCRHNPAMNSGPDTLVGQSSHQHSRITAPPAVHSPHPATLSRWLTRMHSLHAVLGSLGLTYLLLSGLNFEFPAHPNAMFPSMLPEPIVG